ncbi:MAG: hypothetical protein GF399_10670 [Candidatus Coatesbacteria bacterium]|nr:hypothetical protein [Candidatus Coatesbacteria bacterium]
MEAVIKKTALLLLIVAVGLVQADVLFEEDFDSGDLDSWTLEPGEIGQRWIISSQRYYNPAYGVICEEGDQQDERLISPPINLTDNCELTFHWAASYTWLVTPHNNGDYSLEIRQAGGPGAWVSRWNEELVGVFENWTWYETTIAIDDYWEGFDVQFAWRLIGDNAADVWLDTIILTDDASTGVEETSFGQINALGR